MQEYNQKLEVYKKTLAEEGLPLFKESIKEYFIKFPHIKMVVWEQWTPTFNDGEPCEFGIQYVTALDSEEPEAEYDEGFYKEAAEFEDLLDEEFCEVVFGDYSKVYVTPTELRVEECAPGY